MPVCAAMTTSRPNAAVVTDVNQIVELGAAADPGFLKGAAVNRRVGTDLNVILYDQRSLLGELGVFPVGSIANVAEAVCSQYRTRREPPPGPQCRARINDHAGINMAVAADTNPGADDSIRRR